jgi:hypothetical protein
MAVDEPSEEDTGQGPHPGEKAELFGGRHRFTMPAWRRRGRAMAAGGGCVLVTAGLGWVTAVAVGLTGPSGEPVVDALPSQAPQSEPSGPTFGQTLNLDGAHANRASRTSAAPPTTAARPSSSAPSTPARAPDPAPEASSRPTGESVPTVRQGDACRAEGAAAVTKSGGAVVCTVAPGNGGLRWRRA